VTLASPPFHYRQHRSSSAIFFELDDAQVSDSPDKDRMIVQVPLNIMLQVLKFDVGQANGKILLRNGAELINFKELNPHLKIATNCPPFGGPGEKRMYDSKCYGVVLICSYCVYDGNGHFEKDTSNVCGGCVGVPV